MLPEEIEILKKIAEFPEMRGARGRRRASRTTLAYYARELAGLWNPYLQDGVRHRVVSDDAALTNGASASRSPSAPCSRNALELLGISAPERM